MNLRQIRNLDWDAIAGIIAAVAAVVLHLLHIIDESVLLTIAVVLIAMLFLRDLRRERASEEAHAAIADNRSLLREIRDGLSRPDVVLVGPGHLRAASEQFAARAAGEITCFHVCLSMYKPQALFDVLLRPAIENPRVTAIRFVLDPRQKSMWDDDVLPKIACCKGAAKVVPPHWTKIEESVSIMISDSGTPGGAEILLSFWGEPFMAHTTRQVPRYIFHVQPHSELVPRLVELVREFRFAAGTGA